MTRSGWWQRALRLLAAALLVFAAEGALAGPASAGSPGQADQKKPKAASSPSARKKAPTPPTTTPAQPVPGAAASLAEPLAPALTPAPTAPPVSPELAKILDRIQNRYSTAKDVQADFSQTFASSTLGKTTQNASGHVFFKKPGKMRWEYRAPEEQLTIADGKTLWFYQPRINQVLKNEVNEELLSKYTVSFLTGVGDIRKDFRVELAGPDGRAGGAGAGGAEGAAAPIRLVLYPLDEAPFEKVELDVSPETYLVQTTHIYDHFGNVNRIDFLDIRINSGASDSLFQFTVPDGVQVITSPGQAAPVP